MEVVRVVLVLSPMSENNNNEEILFSSGRSHPVWFKVQHCSRCPLYQCLAVRYVYEVLLCREDTGLIAKSVKLCTSSFLGNGHFFYKGQVEDSATAEISRSQVGFECEVNTMYDIQYECKSPQTQPRGLQESV